MKNISQILGVISFKVKITVLDYHINETSPWLKNGIKFIIFDPFFVRSARGEVRLSQPLSPVFGHRLKHA